MLETVYTSPKTMLETVYTALRTKLRTALYKRDVYKVQEKYSVTYRRRAGMGIMGWGGEGWERRGGRWEGGLLFHENRGKLQH